MRRVDHGSPPPRAGGYQFASAYSMAEMLAVLNRQSPWGWTTGDSFWLGDYLAAAAGRPGGSLRLYQDHDRFVLEFRRGAGGPAIHSIVLADILPLLKAEYILPHPGFD